MVPISPLFSEIPGHLGQYAVAEKLTNQYCNKRQFSHTDERAVWNAVSHQPRLFHRISRPSTGDPFAPKITPERQGLRSTVRSKSAPDDRKRCQNTAEVKGAFVRRDPFPVKASDSMAASSTRQRRPHSAAHVSRPKTLRGTNIQTKPMYTSKPKDLFWTVPYYTEGGMQQYWEEQGVKRSTKQPWSASVSGGPRRRFFVGARDPAGPMDGNVEVSIYQVPNYPLSKNERRKIAYDKELAKKCEKVAKWRTGIPRTTPAKLDPKSRRTGRQQLKAARENSEPRGDLQAWRGPRMGPPWYPPHNMRSYPVRPVINGTAQRTVICN